MGFGSPRCVATDVMRHATVGEAPFRHEVCYMKRGRRRSGGWQITMDAALERSPAAFRHVGDGLSQLTMALQCSAQLFQFPFRRIRS